MGQNDRIQGGYATNTAKPHLGLQEQIVMLLLFDREVGAIIANRLDEHYFDKKHDELVSTAMEYWRAYKMPPGENVYSLLSGQGKEIEAKVYFVARLKKFYESNYFNARFVLDQLAEFEWTQKTKEHVYNFAELALAGASADELKSVISNMAALGTETARVEQKSFLDLLNMSKDAPVAEMTLGITPLDLRKIVPQRKELFLFVAPFKSGKSWFLVNAGVAGVIHHLRVLHVTLELSAEKTAQRYLQSMLAVPQSANGFTLPPEWNISEQGVLDREAPILADAKEVTPDLFLDDREHFQQLLENNWFSLQRWNSGLKILEFPTGSLTVDRLSSEISMLEQAGWKPDLLIIDYADLMSVGTKDYRIALGEIYRNLRGLAVEKNLMLVTASQTNRTGAVSHNVSGVHIAEDLSKVMTADTIINYSCSSAEKEHGFARLGVHSRSADDRVSVLITQNYHIGRFCIDSCNLDATAIELLNSTIKKRKLDPNKAEKVARLQVQGLSERQISEKTELTRHQVRRILGRK